MYNLNYSEVNEPDVSVVMPCLNEAETIGICIEKIKNTFLEHNINGEIIVSDNGSSDDSVKIAMQLGAKVIHQPQKGYGNAYIKGIKTARGKFIVIGDADNTYDFSEIPRFIEPLKKGADIVMGSRLKGKIQKGAMPFLHRYLGNPLLSWLVKLMFNVRVSDTHCGMRAFKREVFDKLQLKTPGMEFASEMVIKSAKAKIKVVEIPITYHLRKGESKLRTFKDGWRHLKFMLLLSPKYLFLLPGSAIFLFGLFTSIVLLKGPVVLFGHSFDLHMMILSSFLTISGLQIICLGLFTQIYSHDLFSIDNQFIRFFKQHFTLERGVYLGIVFLFIGFLFGLKLYYNYLNGIIGNSLYYNARLAVFAVTFMIAGLQILFSSFYISFLGLKKEYEDSNNLS